MNRVPFQDKRADRRTGVFTVLASLQRGVQSRQSGAPDSLRAGLADPPEDWPAASSCDAAAMIKREPSECLWCCNHGKQLRYCSPGSLHECMLSAKWPPALRLNRQTWVVSPPVGCYSTIPIHHRRLLLLLTRKLTPILPSHGG